MSLRDFALKTLYCALCRKLKPREHMKTSRRHEGAWVCENCDDD